VQMGCCWRNLLGNTSYFDSNYETIMESDSSYPSGVKKFSSNNPHVKISKEDDKLIINQPWGQEDGQISIPLNDTAAIEQLQHLLINPRFDALMHLDKNEAEFIFAFLDPKNERESGYVDRAFKFHFQGVAFECVFREPSKQLFLISKYYRRLPSGLEQTVPQLVAFRDCQRIKELPDQVKEFFQKRVPRCFFVKSSVPLKEIDWELFSTHLNLLMRYYDRKSPIIVVRPTEDIKERAVEPLRYVEGCFPAELSFKPTDNILLRLIEVARSSEPRFAFIYYYQVFEYAGFYFIDAKTKSSLTRLLRSPSFINCADERVSELLSVLTDAAQNEEGRIRRVIEEFCEPKILWKDIEQNKKFFCADLTFEGGFVVPKLISSDLTEEGWCEMWTPKLIDQVTKIRNCLVHAREKRESRVILPTRANDIKIWKYLPLVSRMAEQIVIHNDKP